MDSVEAPGLAVYTSRPDVNTLRVILTGPLPQGPIARVHIPDTRVESGYSVSVQQIAALPDTPSAIRLLFPCLSHPSDEPAEQRCNLLP